MWVPWNTSERKDPCQAWVEMVSVRLREEGSDRTALGCRQIPHLVASVVTHSRGASQLALLTEARRFLLVVLIYPNRNVRRSETRAGQHFSGRRRIRMLKALGEKVGTWKPVSPRTWLHCVKHQWARIFLVEASVTTGNASQGVAPPDAGQTPGASAM